ncbi:MFS transporter [Rhizobium ruizarguesonis]|uniref:MFS transporter n=1 Tax=Rhizobium ruizarguesonis TaxID=2081791 RepID=UPI002484A276|nr:MFS transporter [Rhizobium ruizarguesonis]
MPTLTRELGASQTQGLWIINAYPLVMAGLLLGAGTLGDRLGHRFMFLVGLVLFGVASAVAAFAPSANVLIAACLSGCRSFRYDACDACASARQLHRRA